MAENYVRHALEVFAGYDDAEAIVAADGRRYSFADLRARIRDTAAALWHHGIQPGMTVAILVSNPPESYFVLFGAHLLGCRTVFMGKTMAPAFLRDVVAFVHADAFVYEVAIAAELGRELAEAAAPLPTLCIGPGGIGPDLNDAPAVTELPFDPEGVGVEPVTLFQTSGTTGTPKLVQHGERFYRTIPTVAAFYQPPDRPIRHLLPSGTWHSGGQAAAILTWVSGGTVVFQSGWDISVFLDAIAAERITSINLAPPSLYQLLDDARLADTDLSSLYQVTVSAAPAAPARLSQAIDRFGEALNVVYGMGELPFITALPNLAHHRAHPERLASCGRPWGDVRLEIRDPAGVVLPAGEIGEICVASDLLTEGYFGAPEEIAGRLVDGWLRTGDAGRLDADGYLYIVDRLNDMILTDLGSQNIYCRPIEDALNGHPEVRQAAVIGVPDELLGEAIHAYVIRSPDATVTEDELRQLVVEQLNELWSPREVEFIGSFPLTESGKVDKKQLRARHLARADERTAAASAL